MLTKFILNDVKTFEFLKSYDTIIPVPISDKRRKERGYNQSEIIAKEIAKKVNIEYQNKCLFKYKDIIEQSKLNKQQRQENIKDVYVLKNKHYIEGKKLLLLDDVYTTGSTVNECCRIIRQANISSIDVITIAKD